MISLFARKSTNVVLFSTFFFAVIILTAQPTAYRTGIFIKQLGAVGGNTIRIKQDPTNGNLYILERNNGIVKRVNFNADSAATFVTVYQNADHGVTSALGFAIAENGTMFIVGNDSSQQSLDGSGKIVKGVPTSPGSETRTWSILAKTVPYQYGNTYNHRMSGIAVDPSGDYVYVNSGAATDHGELRNGQRSTGLTDIILKLPTNGQDILLQDDREWLRTNGYLMAEGIRNHFDLAFAGNGDLFGVENSGDRDDPEEMNWIREGHHYGWPWRIGGNNTPQQYSPYNPMTDPLLNPQAWGGGNLYQTFSNDPTFPQRPDSITFTEPIMSTGPDGDKYRDTTNGQVRDASQLGTGIYTFTAHRSPNGLVFDKDSVLKGELKGGGFVLSLASGNTFQPLGDTSRDILHVELTKVGDSLYTAKVKRLVYGFVDPLGIEIVGNKLFVVETGVWFPANPSPKLYQITLPADGTTNVVAGSNSVPNKFVLEQNYPNPFNPATRIKYSVAQTGNVSLKVFDILGKEVATLVNGIVAAGNHEVRFYAGKLSGGIYFYRLTADGFVAVKKMLYLK